MCKPLSLEDLAKLDIFKKNQTEITSKIAYLIGVKEEYLTQFFDDYEEEVKILEKSSCFVIRNLSILRTKLLTNYMRTENAFRYDLMNLDRMDMYKTEVKALERCKVNIVKANYRVNKYIVDINDIISKRIDECRNLFPDWIEWKYIKRMFIMPNGTKEDKIINESSKFNANRGFYPFGCYVNWDPKDEGNVLVSDKKFLNILYAQNNDYFTEINKVTDVNDSVKSGIYDFIDRNKVVDVVVDCENSDAYRLYSTLKGLDDEKISKINKVILYDDIHTTPAWKMLTEEFRGIIDFEYILVERLNEAKSLVDHKMIADISKEHYREEVDAFIIVSSDSDYWAIINSIEDADFLVMVEKEKVGSNIREALDKKGVFYCYINDFCSSKAGQFENKVLDAELKKQLEKVIQLNAKDLLRSVYQAARITSGETEKENYYNKHIKTLKLVIDDLGNMKIV
ncbi:MAG: NYN domain-containing protein [Clostridiales bacterium]|nr:NYN domain-containing protein [Clostridiales bacterium]